MNFIFGDLTGGMLTTYKVFLTCTVLSYFFYFILKNKMESDMITRIENTLGRCTSLNYQVGTTQFIARTFLVLTVLIRLWG